MKTKEIDPNEKRKRSENFKSYMNRGGPNAPGSKTISDGKTNCLKNLTFVISGNNENNQITIYRIVVPILGVLESLERDECKSLIEKYGGRVTMAISGKTNYLIVGRDASEAKINKAREINLKIISEDDLLELIRTLPGDEEKTKRELPKMSETSAVKSKAEISPVKSKSKSSAIVSKATATTDPTVIIPTVSVDTSTLLCKYLFN